VGGFRTRSNLWTGDDDETWSRVLTLDSIRLARMHYVSAPPTSSKPTSTVDKGTYLLQLFSASASPRKFASSECAHENFTYQSHRTAVSNRISAQSDLNDSWQHGAPRAPCSQIFAAAVRPKPLSNHSLVAPPLYVILRPTWIVLISNSSTFGDDISSISAKFILC